MPICKTCSSNASVNIIAAHDPTQIRAGQRRSRRSIIDFVIGCDTGREGGGRNRQLAVHKSKLIVRDTAQSAVGDGNCVWAASDGAVCASRRGELWAASKSGGVSILTIDEA